MSLLRLTIYDDHLRQDERGKRIRALCSYLLSPPSQDFSGTADCFKPPSYPIATITFRTRLVSAYTTF